ncbi:uncharacterized protein PODANS_7_495 [Podospora anserina S mat+]|uniref:Podospora anserina S mat+ genomic DNA chromosome 7, supercontig 3 n=1 Tax=Podospora anserina (strain S / ATCC MYA-4624 / DSM 980 / FGSC 10383) TaxID=515849 RepID=B2AP58_PODAN|nr:uncharacterized protein PODANS_7_495 [Podospora anserina S mat+]CAP65752.1 unnamed protein product [Podospora anserina S mat+]CDP32811.1 Putative protein of unknown function [Podospora anserina S mat+]
MIASRLLLSLLLSLSGVLGQRCQWSHLRQSSDRYSELQTSPQHTPSPSDPLFFPAPKPYPFYNNAILTPLNQTILATTQVRPLHTHSIIDQEGCSSYTRLITNDAILAVQIFYESATNTGGVPLRVKEIHTVYFLAPGNSTEKIQANVKRETWPSFSRSDQDARSTLKGVFDAYLDANGPVAWAGSCSMLDSGKGGDLRAGQGDQCAELRLQLKEGQKIEQRMYVIDESLGAVTVSGVVGGKVAGFEGRVVKGKLEYVHQFGDYCS